MKKNNRGFTLVETLVVSSFIVGILVFLFAQFSKLKKSYDASFEYNTIPALYKAKNINRYVLTSGNDTLVQELEKSSIGFIDITECPMDYLEKIDYCSQLFSDLGVVSVIVAKEATFKTDLQDYLRVNNTAYHEKLYQFVKNLSINTENYDGYRFIIEFEDDNFATIKMTY